MITCDRYVGVSCVNGTCPIALREEKWVYEIPLTISCKECYCNEGCKDCMLDGTKDCVKRG